MATQLNPAVYAQAIDQQLSLVLGAIPVYQNFNRNFATEGKFVTWQLRNVHQEVYTGTNQANKGIDRPTVSISIFTQRAGDGLTIANTLLQALHGYAGQFGVATSFWVSKIDCFFLFSTYDDELGLHQVILDCTLDIPA